MNAEEARERITGLMEDGRHFMLHCERTKESFEFEPELIREVVVWEG